MMKILPVGAAVCALLALGASGAKASTFVVSYEGEAAGVENTTATFKTNASGVKEGGVETFNSQPVHGYPQTITTDYGTGGLITGTYTAGTASGIQINAADQYGGAGGNTNYIAAFTGTPYTLTLSSTIPGGIDYFGFWLSALDKGNFVTFYGGDGNKLFTFDPQDVLTAVAQSADPSLYYGNPNPGSFHGKDSGEPYIFLNFFDQGGTFSKIEFSEVNNGGGYESDNHTVGQYATMGNGTVIQLVHSVTVPEPSTWAMMLAGFAGLLWAGAHGKRRPVRSIDA
ncbi:putative secreted protein with PEP-CTERM sorting signal [Roseiarcus fermentans]|uniref:Putative secreted protein with PEP-CTERM sorting signal n=1 Tax=Roseiarcus fermentans TaxID=1473586 RepID=A0A366F1W0_9HYPH|nr:PEP-CTERM sorting domain-containing protein [Roseiarcus fermentans]RBP08584.1 putative secreted protein with PEP-CTERM sorting signal [Roseiarcus fermentans]